MHPANLALRFALEIAALAGIGAWAWAMTAGWLRPVAVLGAVAAAALLWTLFNVPGDPSRSGAAPVAVPGWARLILELAILLGGALAFHRAGHSGPGAALAGLVVLHYALSGDRLAWLLRQ
ncbi:MAG: YrdB family protein [Rhodobacter sp.]|nr:YrdB family protein [Rhodobacter sp.]